MLSTIVDNNNNVLATKLALLSFASPSAAARKSIHSIPFVKRQIHNLPPPSVPSLVNRKEIWVNCVETPPPLPSRDNRS
jgi:hypothetical protein